MLLTSHICLQKMFCQVGNIVIQHESKSPINKHFASAKHTWRMSKTQGIRQTRQTVKQAIASCHLQVLKESRLVGFNIHG